MKTDSFTSHRPRQSQGGSAVLIVLVLLMTMVWLAAANTSTLNRLRQFVNIVDQRQTRRLAEYSSNSLPAADPATNQPAAK
jgi:hypothetical protein